MDRDAESAQLLGCAILAINSGAKAGVVPGVGGWQGCQGTKNGDLTSKNGNLMEFNYHKWGFYIVLSLKMGI